jgi:hypothetical protein
MRVVELFLLAHIVGAVLLIAGFRTRAAATLAWATYLPIRYSAHLYFYGIGGMLLIALFYCMVLPTGREWSVDRALAGRADGSVERELDAALSVGVLRIHLCIVYLAAGLSKAIGPTWWTGDAVWRALSLPRFAQFDLAALSGYPEMLQAAGLAAVVAQLAYPVLVWTRLRAAIVLLAELLHLGIAVFLGLWLFSAVMMVLNVAAFGESLWLALRRWRGAQHAPAWGSR